MLIRLFGILLLTFSPVTLFASEIMFEGYYKIELEGKQIGYAIQRYAFDPKTNTFESTQFQRLKLGNEIIQETVKGKATDKFHPISYQYTAQAGDKLKLIDATFKGEIMTAKITENGKQRVQTSKVPKKTFLESFLPYLMIMQDLKINDSFKYSAVAEEDGNSYDGRAFLQAKEMKPGMEVFTILNKFKGDDFISKMAILKDAKTGKNIKGEVLQVTAPAKNLASHLMASANQATEGQLVPNKTLLTAFGNIPTGKVNTVATPPNTEVGDNGGKTIASPVPPTTPRQPLKPTEPVVIKKGQKTSEN
jgi:hypothetical protein